MSTKESARRNKFIFLFLVVGLSWIGVGLTAALIALITTIVLYGICYYLLVHIPKKCIEYRESRIDEPLI